MANTEVYPQRPFRPNFTDIRTMQIFDPVVTDSKTNIGASWVQLYPTGATLENGVRIKNTWSNDRDIAVTARSVWSTGGDTGTGFTLGQDEELFLEVRQLSDVWVYASGANGSAGFIAS